MPLALPAAAELFGLLVLSFIILKLAQAIVESLDVRLPVIGRPFHGTLRSIENGIVAAINGFLRPLIRACVHAFKMLADVLLLLPLAIVVGVAGLIEALDYLRHTTIPNLLNAATLPLARAIQGLHAADLALARAIRGAEREFTHGIDRLREFVEVEVLRRLQHGIDRLRRDVYEDTIPELRQIINRGDALLERGLGAARDEIGSLEKDLLGLAKRLDIPLTLIESLIAAVGVTAAAEALETLVGCRGKMRQICTVDPQDWSNLILGLTAIAVAPGFREMVEMGATVMEDLHDAVTMLAES